MILLVALPRSASGACVETCHKNVTRAKFVHGPVGSGDCDTCHTRRVKAEGPGHKKGEMSVPAQTRKLCLQCHDTIEAQLKGPYQHKPVAAVDCVFCHDPHSSPRRYMLRPSSRVKAKDPYCFACHDRDLLRGKRIHKPLAEGKCHDCHNVHGSSAAKLLVRPQKDLCLKCHKVKWQQRKVVHGPVAAGMCGACHSPHTAPEPKLLNLPLKKLCVGCHEEKGTTERHGAVQGFGADCLGCHDVHGTNTPHLLKGS